MRDASEYLVEYGSDVHKGPPCTDLAGISYHNIQLYGICDNDKREFNVSNNIQIGGNIGSSNHRDSNV